MARKPKKTNLPSSNSNNNNSSGPIVTIPLPDIQDGDSFKVIGNSNMALVNIKKEDGSIITRKINTINTHSFQYSNAIVTNYNASTPNREERDQIILKLINDGFKQTEVALMTGVSQSTVSNIVKNNKIK
ncbi:hypothetical protein O7M46_10370 [Bisgaard Taxon 45]|uniref:Helix-turn-helix domain-containing protein n=1 Tax=Bisgaard Taxon 45 TaxID=304289 RepID=A0ABT9KH21_9PAST|nr:hypothetical protein [Bisgaard Taxon 45]